MDKPIATAWQAFDIFRRTGRVSTILGFLFVNRAAISLQLRAWHEQRSSNMKGRLAVVPDHSLVRLTIPDTAVGFIDDRHQDRNTIRGLPATVAALVAFSVSNPVRHTHYHS